MSSQSKTANTIILPNKETIEVDETKSYFDIFAEHLPNIIKRMVAVKCEDKILDLHSKVNYSGKVSPVTIDSEEGKEIYWHSSAHVLAQAVKRVYPEAQLTFGPVTKHGPGFFYYDIFMPNKSITDEDLPVIELQMQKIASESLQISRTVYERAEAIKEFKGMGEDFKAQIVEDLPADAEISVYKQGDFQDLCRGPHVPNTDMLGNFKLTAIAGAYWKGDSDNPMLQRLYGISFPTGKELKSYLNKIEEAKKRDHRKLGKELDLFSFHEEAPGMPFYHPKGTVLFNALQDYIRLECDRRDYDELRTPTVLSDELWHKSGHYENFKENMYFTELDDRGFAIKPMNCPGSTLVFSERPRSYRDLPMRLSELGMVHRHELSGVLHGLFRVRAFTQDDAHIYCTPEQLRKEIEKTIEFTIDVYKKFGFEKVNIFIATKPEKAMGSDEVWEESTKILHESLQSMDLEYKIKEGEGAFYGPKIEFNVEDSLERNWQLGTIQVDFSMPARFELDYIGSDGLKHTPIMVHRAILGSLERFMGILIEHYAGKMPLWLSPTQVRVLTVTQTLDAYAEEVEATLRKAGIRTDRDFRDEKIGYKVREWNAQKINYAVIIGEKEKEADQIAIRKRGDKDSPVLSLENFIKQLQDEGISVS